MKDCLYVLYKLHPYLFSKRGLINLEKLASPLTKRFTTAINTDTEMYLIPFDVEREIIIFQ